MEKNSSYPVAPPEDMDDDSDDYEKHLEVNWNHVWRDQYEKDLEQYSEIIDASGMDDFLAKTDASGKPVDMHPEKRMKAAWHSFVDANMPLYRKDNPKLKRSQILQMMSRDVGNNYHLVEYTCREPYCQGQGSRCVERG